MKENAKENEKLPFSLAFFSENKFIERCSACSENCFDFACSDSDCFDYSGSDYSGCSGCSACSESYSGSDCCTA